MEPVPWINFTKGEMQMRFAEMRTIDVTLIHVENQAALWSVKNIS
jgi:hypothetical protein